MDHLGEWEGTKQRSPTVPRSDPDLIYYTTGIANKRYDEQEWRHQLRSSIHPLLFAAVYKVADLLAHALRLTPATRADLLVAAPKCAQAVFAALADWYTWKLAGLVYGRRSREAWVTVGLAFPIPTPPG